MKKTLIIILSICSLSFAAQQSENFQKAEDYFYEGKLEIARLFYGKEIAENPDNWKAYFHRGKIFLYKGDLDDALTDMITADELHPRNALIYHSTGDVYAMKKQADQALEYYQKAAARDKEFGFPWLNQGHVYLYLKKDRENTIRVWETFLQIMPDYVQNPDIRKAIEYLRDPDFSWDQLGLENETPMADSGSMTNRESSTNEPFTLPVLELPDIRGEGREAGLSERKRTAGRKTIETE